MIGANPSSNVRTVSVLVVPFVLMFGIYVAAHGHYGPGGGFAGGVIAAVAIVVVRMVVPRSLSERFFPPGLALWLMILGVGIFVGMALASLFIGGNLLDYDELPLPGDPSKQRYYGILIVEFGVLFGVCGAMVYIFDLLASVLNPTTTRVESAAPSRPGETPGTVGSEGSP